MECFRIRPVVFLSSGVRPSPAFFMMAGVRLMYVFPSMMTSPESAGSEPKMPPSSSVRPEPRTPAMPSTSPLYRVKEMSSYHPARVRCLTSITGSAVGTTSAGRLRISVLPNIMAIIPALSISSMFFLPTYWASRRTVTVSAISCISASL